jgi:hypothetical protein
LDLIELVNGAEIQQDEWSLTAPTFGEDGQLKVVGFFWNTQRKLKRKSYIIHCQKCKEDPELFGEGYFKTDRGDITRNMLPCGCSGHVRWSAGQYGVLCTRKAAELGYSFLGFEGVWGNRKTKVRLLCEKHGEWVSGNVGNLINNGRGCPGCGRKTTEDAKRVPLEARLKSLSTLCEGTSCSLVGVPDDYKQVFDRITMTCSLHGDWETSMKKATDGFLCPKCGRLEGGKNRTKPDDVMVSKFMATTAFTEGTLFTKLGYKDNGKSEWQVDCPDCGQSGVSTLDNLQQGKRPCSCSPMRQQECYINLVRDGDNTLALKFGIANNSLSRIYAQHKASVYDIKSFSIYKFPDVASCKKAERECKKELQTCVISKSEMPDGWTETTYVYNLDKIKQIYQKHGGIEV